MKQILGGDTLAKLNDGYFGKITDEALRQVMKDIQERGHDGKKRTITIKVTLAPDGETGQVKIDTEVGYKLPSYVPPTTIGKYNAAVGGVVFRDDAPENPDQTTTNDLMEK